MIEDSYFASDDASSLERNLEAPEYEIKGKRIEHGLELRELRTNIKFIVYMLNCLLVVQLFMSSLVRK